MRRPQSLRLAGAGVLVAAAMAAASGPVAAQGMLSEPLRIGVVLPVAPADAPVWDLAVARGAEQGAVIAEEEFVFNAEMLGMQMAVLRAPGGSPEEAVAAAQRLVEDEGAYAIIGGYTDAEAAALGAWAQDANVPFVNVGAAGDILRSDMCFSTTFHIEPSAGMYLDAMAGWYVRAGFRNWFILGDGSYTSTEQHRRLTRTLQERHFGAREVGTIAMTAGGETPSDLLAELDRTDADLLVLLVSAADQLQVMSDLDAAGLDLQVTGFPYPETQTRAYFAAQQEAAPTIGTNNRITSWEATLDAYGAREMNARYRARFNEPMDPSAWSTYQAVKILYEAAFFTGSLDPATVVAYMTAPTTVFDVYKGIGTSFRPWDRQLRQTLYLDKIADTPEPAFNMALLVGELPAIYMPGTDPVERLDQLGDLAAQSTCGR